MTSNNYSISEKHSILLFDGVCNLCNHSVQFIIQRDSREQFRFAALQSEIGQAIIQKYDLEEDLLQTLVLIEKNRVYLRSTAALRVARQLNGLWPLLYIFILIPPFIRDRVYDWIANHRYRWFGKRQHCMMPTQALKKRFLV